MVKPAFRGPLCATAHPEGCSAQVRAWVNRMNAFPPVGGPRRILIIGASGGLGLAARIAAAFGNDARSIGVCLERPGLAERPGTAGWYRTVAFEQLAAREGLLSRTVVGDAFADEVKARTCDVVAATVGELDQVIYALAAPRRRHPRTGLILRSVLKTTGRPFRDKAFDLYERVVRPITVEAATDTETADTIAVMGGEDWSWWIEALLARGLLAKGAGTVALSYVGPPRLAPTYRGGTLGAAKDHLETTAARLDDLLARRCLGSARVAVMRAMVTQSSLVIPMSALYTMLLLRVSAELGLGEDTLDQGQRLLATASSPSAMDDKRRWRLDDLEMRDDVQNEVWRRWDRVATDSLPELGDLDLFERELHGVYGFDVPGVDYAAPVELVRTSPTVLM
ncbi:enoyl-ACP reductase FabV [Krasilnikovia sp. M28-CT-15]|uniref:enoyl-ACP reductase FabV n=1 Tax=Krasilnikovia sp. M28-CT-15 TaxID=3373540 RepID=UPI00399C7577